MICKGIRPNNCWRNKSIERRTLVWKGMASFVLHTLLLMCIGLLTCGGDYSSTPIFGGTSPSIRRVMLNLLSIPVVGVGSMVITTAATYYKQSLATTETAIPYRFWRGFTGTPTVATCLLLGTNRHILKNRNTKLAIFWLLCILFPYTAINTLLNASVQEKATSQIVGQATLTATSDLRTEYYAGSGIAGGSQLTLSLVQAISQYISTASDIVALGGKSVAATNNIPFRGPHPIETLTIAIKNAGAINVTTRDYVPQNAVSLGYINSTIYTVSCQGAANDSVAYLSDNSLYQPYTPYMVGTTCISNCDSESIAMAVYWSKPSNPTDFGYQGLVLTTVDCGTSDTNFQPETNGCQPVYKCALWAVGATCNVGININTLHIVSTTNTCTYVSKTAGMEYLDIAVQTISQASNIMRSAEAKVGIGDAGTRSLLFRGKNIAAGATNPEDLTSGIINYMRFLSDSTGFISEISTVIAQQKSSLVLNIASFVALILVLFGSLVTTLLLGYAASRNSTANLMEDEHGFMLGKLGTDGWLVGCNDNSKLAIKSSDLYKFAVINNEIGREHLKVLISKADPGYSVNIEEIELVAEQEAQVVNKSTQELIFIVFLAITILVIGILAITLPITIGHKTQYTY